MMQNKKYKLSLKILDFLIFFLAIGICVFSITYASSKKSGSSNLVISSPEGEFIYPLDKNEVLQFSGKEGKSVIQINDKSACFLESPCKNRTCIASGSIKENGQWAACLPNGIFIRIEAEQIDSDIDITSF